MSGAASWELVCHAAPVRVGGLGVHRHANWQEEEEEAPVFEPGFDIGSSDAAPAVHRI
jgi:hypothetical protein